MCKLLIDWQLTCAKVWHNVPIHLNQTLQKSQKSAI